MLEEEGGEEEGGKEGEGGDMCLLFTLTVCGVHLWSCCRGCYVVVSKTVIGRLSFCNMMIVLHKK